MTDPSISILCVDDHPLFREGVATVITSEPDLRLVATASSGAAGIEAHRRLRPDVTLMDLRLPDMSGITAMAAIRAEYESARIVILTSFEGDVEMQRALAAGARGYLLKSAPSEELVEVIRAVARGRRHIPPTVAQHLAARVGEEALSQREIEVLMQLAAGNRNKDIGSRLSISEETVKAHVRHILEKLGARDRTQAVAIGIRRGFIHV